MAYNYIAYTKDNRPRIGILNLDENTINPLAYKSGTPVSTLYEVIEAGDDTFTRSDEVIQVKDVKILPPLSGRDVLAVGKNYVDHAKEFNQSGYDSSDKIDQPTHPVIFTKRATSIIAHGEDILPHAQFTESVDYEGEIGVIIGKTGFRISEENALDHVWGYTIINDVSARERQRDHKQFYIGKSPDTFCPMGPIAVPKEHLPEILTLQTFVNGEKRQEATSDMLIFSVPCLIKTLSEGSTLQAGDVIATGTPVGVGFGFRPMKFLHPGDEISIKITGLGTLTNRIAAHDAPNATSAKISSASHIPWSNSTALATETSGLRSVGNKKIFYRRLGVAKTPADNIVFIHGQYTSSEYFTPLLPSLQDGKALHLIDLEGHGLSPTRATSSPSIASYAQDISTLLAAEGVQSTAVVSHAVGSMVGVHLALSRPHLVSKLVLMSPRLSLPTSIAAQGLLEASRRVQENGVSELLINADFVENCYFSEKSKASNRAAIAAARQFIISKNPDGYAKYLAARALAPEQDVSKINSPVLILTGSEALYSPPEVCEGYATEIPHSELQVLQGVGHFEVLEDEVQTSQVVSNFLVK